VKFRRTELPDVWLLELEPHHDDRGWFAREFCAAELAAHGLELPLVQCNLSYNRHRGTLRGLHWQAPPFEETKIVRVLTGAVLDVVVDIRPGSPTRGRFVMVRLAADRGQALYVPRGFAHGFLTLEDHTLVLYHMSAMYHPDAARGARWDDPAFGIPWPETPRYISARDRSYPPFDPGQGGAT